jgi:hypothetical protein
MKRTLLAAPTVEVSLGCEKHARIQLIGRLAATADVSRCRRRTQQQRKQRQRSAREVLALGASP